MAKQKVPVLYLVDSILKNVGKDYVDLFSRNIAQVFVSAFEHVDTKSRNNFSRVRKTWGGIFPPIVLETIDDGLQKFGVPRGPSSDPRRNPRRSSRDYSDQPGVVVGQVNQEKQGPQDPRAGRNQESRAAVHDNSAMPDRKDRLPTARRAVDPRRRSPQVSTRALCCKCR